MRLSSLLLALMLSAGPWQGAADDVKPPTDTQPSEDEVREEMFKAALKGPLDAGCKVVTVWEGVVTWTRIVHIDCHGTSIAQIFGWRGSFWTTSESFMELEMPKEK